MITKEIKQSFPPRFFYSLHGFVFFAVYLPGVLVVNINNQMFGATLSNHSQKINSHPMYTLSMIIYSDKSIIMIYKGAQILISEHLVWSIKSSN